jgi:hypothetical protein
MLSLANLEIKQQITEAISESFHSFFSSIFKRVAIGIIDNSYMICLVVCLLALALYIGGQRKAGKYVGGSFIVYYILQALRVFIK